MRVPRSEGERVRDPVRGVIHNMHRIEPPLPRTPTPCYRHLFLTGRGGLTDNGIHLNLSLGLSNQPGPPHGTHGEHETIDFTGEVIIALSDDTAIAVKE